MSEEKYPTKVLIAGTTNKYKDGPMMTLEEAYNSNTPTVAKNGVTWMRVTRKARKDGSKYFSRVFTKNLELTKEEYSALMSKRSKSRKGISQSKTDEGQKDGPKKKKTKKKSKKKSKKSSKKKRKRKRKNSRKEKKKVEEPTQTGGGWFW
jgi:hypothetical protein